MTEDGKAAATVLFHSPWSDTAAWVAGLGLHLPAHRVIDLADLADPGAVQYAVLWDPPPGLLGALTNLAVVFTPSAGVEHLLQADEVPARVPICRLTDAGMADQMVEYALWAALTVQRDMDRYHALQAARDWQPQDHRPRHAITIGVLGLGVLGASVAEALRDFGYTVAGWSRRPRDIAGVTCLHGPAGLDDLVVGAEVLVNLLPLTPATEGLIDRRLLFRLPPGAVLVNMARGRHVVAADLLMALDQGHLRRAILDVFDPEPLPPGHPFWHHPQVTITPHVAAQTVREQAVRQIARNILSYEAGTGLDGRVDRAHGY